MGEFKSIECNSIESIDTPNLNNQQFRLNKITEIEENFIAEITERELMSKKLSKYISFFDYFDCFISNKWWCFYCIVCNSFGAPIGITSASFSLAFSLCTGLVKKLLKATRNKKKKHNKIVDGKISEAVINNQISHEDFITIINEERNYRELKEIIRMMKGQEDKK